MPEHHHFRRVDLSLPIPLAREQHIRKPASLRCKTRREPHHYVGCGDSRQWETAPRCPSPISKSLAPFQPTGLLHVQALPNEPASVTRSIRSIQHTQPRQSKDCRFWWNCESPSHLTWTDVGWRAPNLKGLINVPTLKGRRGHEDTWSSGILVATRNPAPTRRRNYGGLEHKVLWHPGPGLL